MLAFSDVSYLADYLTIDKLRLMERKNETMQKDNSGMPLKD